MFLSKLSVNKPVLTAVIILFFVVLGLYSYLGLSVDLFPEIDIPYVTVQTIYPGAGPAEIETLISKSIEEAVGSINGVETIISSSVEDVISSRSARILNIPRAAFSNSSFKSLIE